MSNFLSFYKDIPKDDHHPLEYSYYIYCGKKKEDLSIYRYSYIKIENYYDKMAIFDILTENIFMNKDGKHLITNSEDDYFYLDKTYTFVNKKNYKTMLSYLTKDLSEEFVKVTNTHVI